MDVTAAVLLSEYCDRERLAGQGISIPYDRLTDIDVEAIRIIRSEFDAIERKRLDKALKDSKAKSRK